MPYAMTMRVGAADSAATSGWYALIALDAPESSGSSRLPSSSAGSPNAVGSGVGAAR